MRTIKFRGKRVDNGEWIEGYVYCGDIYGRSTDINNAVEVLIINNDYDEWEVIKETVGQFTGLYDKNGKEIYEGDIIKEFNGYGSDNGIAKIEYDTATFDLGARHEYRQTICGFIAKAIDNQKYNSESSTQSFYEKECEVIGNIHDKKEKVEE